MSSLVDIGSAKLNAKTGMVTAQCKGVENEDGEAEDFGDLNMAFAVGFAAVPAPANDDGNAQGFVMDDVPGQDGVCVGGFDSRTTKSYADLAPGETVMFATGTKFDSRVFCKDQMVAIIVGDDAAIVVDRKAKKTTITSNGCHWEQSDDNGILFRAEGAEIQLKSGVVSIKGTAIVLGGAMPVQPLIMGPSGVTGVPTPGVFYGK
jgi:hypothetical protein